MHFFSRLWKAGLVPYSVQRNTFLPHQIQQIENEMAQFNQRTNNCPRVKPADNLDNHYVKFIGDGKRCFAEVTGVAKKVNPDNVEIATEQKVFLTR